MLAHVQRKLFIATFFITAIFFTTSIVFAQMYQFNLNLNSLQQKFSLTSNYLGTNSVVVKSVDCINEFIKCVVDRDKKRSSAFLKVAT